MSVESDVRAYLLSKSNITAIIGSKKFYTGFAPQSAAPPYITYEVINYEGVRNFGGASALASVTIEYDLITNTLKDASALTEALRNALDGFSGMMGATDVRNLMLDSYIDNTTLEPQSSSQRKIFRRTLDFTVTHAQAVPNDLT